MFLLSPEADMRPDNLQAQVQQKNAFWLADREARGRLTKGFLANWGRSVMRLRRTGRTQVIAESQRNGGFSLADSQSFDLNVRTCTGKRGVSYGSSRKTELPR